MRKHFTDLAVKGPEDLVFGRAPNPVQCGDLTIGTGVVFPEVNFTLPVMEINPDTWPEVLRQYNEITTGIIRRAVALQVPGIVLEFEHLPAMTQRPEWGAEITALLKRHLAEARAEHSLRSALRVTVCDIRDQGKRPALRSGPFWEQLRRSFELCIEAGADIVSIESIGGKEVHDPALMYGNIPGIVFALAVLAPRDMARLWDYISSFCAGTSVVPGGDSACAFANTAMALVHQKLLPEVLAAVIRAMSASCSLVAVEHGAIGPLKDCAYENPIIKAITGCPISMEGKSAACAHFSPMGNIPAAMCDLWSNESVQNVRLLSGNAPEVFTEILAFDCRLMNAATAAGGALTLQRWMVDSDQWLSPQAAMLSPQAAYEIGAAIVAVEDDNYQRTVGAGQAAVNVLRRGLASGQLSLSGKEATWLDRIEAELLALPATEEELREQVAEEYGDLYDPESYGL